MAKEKGAATELPPADLQETDPEAYAALVEEQRETDARLAEAEHQLKVERGLIPPDPEQVPVEEEAAPRDES